MSKRRKGIMKKVDFIKTFAEKARLSQKDAKEILEIAGAEIVEHMHDEDGVSPFAGMKFTCTYVEERQGRNPKTGETIVIPGRYQPKVKFGTPVKDALNKK